MTRARLRAVALPIAVAVALLVELSWTPPRPPPRPVPVRSFAGITAGDSFAGFSVTAIGLLGDAGFLRLTDGQAGFTAVLRPRGSSAHRPPRSSATHDLLFERPSRDLDEKRMLDALDAIAARAR